MTETSSLLRNPTSFLKTIPSSNPFTVTTSAALASPLPNGTLSDTNPQEEEEYTIKCICIYTDDDGNTVYCPKCDTWQHIECYYHGKKVPDEHFCSDCLPRDLDRKKATERQRRVREQLESGDRKVKRPATKTSKKKQKDSTPSEQTNGWTVPERQESIPIGKDQPPPAKKPKTNHRTTGSVVSLNGEPRKRAYSNVQSYPSPSKSPQDAYRFPIIPQYTTEFLDLYERDEGTTDCYDNEYTITASNFLSAWKADPSLVVSHAVEQPSAKSPFVHTIEDLGRRTWPIARLRAATWDTVIDGKHPTWRYLVLETGVQKNEIMGEIKGEVGMLEEYCQQQSNQNRWAELAHPDPFVFFHPHMNIYIDSRKKGTTYRYLRRSCQPNVTLKTFVNDDGDMRHCFVANQDIESGSELTAAWFINPSMFDMTANREDSEQLENQRCEWVSRVLANFGDCACDKTQCPWARLDRRVSLRSSESSTKSLTGRTKKKGKSKQAISPLSTGQATNSRAGSEAIKGPEDDEQYDRRSTSESSRSGVRSREISPVNVAVLDADPVLGSGLTARELRKIQAAEKAFERKGGVGDKKKKKRTSGGSLLNTPNAGTSKQLAHSPNGTDGKRLSGSPPPARVLKDGSNRSSVNTRPQPTRPVYKSVSCQTDPEDCEITMPPPKRRKFSTPTQRLLKKVLQDRMMYENQGSKSPPVLSPLNMTSESTMTGDLQMGDVGSALSPSSSSSASNDLSPTCTRESGVVNSPPMTYPSQAAHTQTHFKSPPARLHLHTLPPVPTFTNGITTPGSASSPPALNTPSMAQSPNILSVGSPSYQSLNALTQPSPIKKKLSLGDYMSRRNLSATPVNEKTQAQANADMTDGGKDMEFERKSSYAGSDGQVEGSKNGVEADTNNDESMKDDDEPEYSPPGASPVPEELYVQSNVQTGASTMAMPSGINPDVANVLAQLAQFQDRARSQSAGSA